MVVVIGYTVQLSVNGWTHTYTRSTVEVVITRRLQAIFFIIIPSTTLYLRTRLPPPPPLPPLSCRCSSSLLLLPPLRSGVFISQVAGGGQTDASTKGGRETNLPWRYQYIVGTEKKLIFLLPSISGVNLKGLGNVGRSTKKIERARERARNMWSLSKAVETLVLPKTLF